MEVLGKLLRRRTPLSILRLQQRRLLTPEAQSCFPYVFKNASPLVKTRERTKPESLEIMSELLTHEDFRLQDGFSYVYLSLLKALQEGSVSDLGSFCERNLYRAFADGLGEVNQGAPKIELLNEEEFPRNIRMELIDFSQTFGVYLDREENRTKQVQRFSGFLARKSDENFDVYMPSIKDYGDKLTLNMSLLLKVDTNLKLNLVYPDGRSLIEEHERDQYEVHYVQMESIISSYDIKLSTIIKLLGEIFKSNRKLSFSEWTVTDFDHFLQGNPHIPA